MAALTGNTIATTYTELLRMGNATLHATTGYYIKDSADTNSALSIAATRVGIGTASPGNLLTIESASYATLDIIGQAGHATLNLDGGGSGDAKIYYNLDTAGTPLWVMGCDDSDSDKFKLVNGNADLTSGNAAIVVDSSRNVGIGTASPLVLLHVDSASVATGDAGASINLTYSKASGNIANTNGLGYLTFGGKDDDNTLSDSNQVASIKCLADGSWGDGDRGTMLQFQTTTGEVTSTVMTIEKNKRVGIGTTTPSTLLQIKGADVAHSTTVPSQLNILDTAAFGASPQAGISFQGYTTGTTAFTMGGIYMAKENTLENNESSTMSFLTRKEDSDPAVAMTLDEDGKVGIGTTTPQELLHIESSSATTNVPTLLVSNMSTTAAHAGGNISLRRGDPDANLGDDINIGDISWYGQDNSDDAWIDAAFITCQTNGSPGTNSMPAELQFWTNSGADNATQKMTILANGNVGIGITAPEATLCVSDAVEANIQSTWDGEGVLALVGAGIANQATTTHKIILSMHLPIAGTGSPKGSSAAFALSHWEDPSSNYPRTRLDICTTGRSTDTSDPNVADTIMSIRDDGNVGIGTTAPETALQINTSDNTTIDQTDGTNSNINANYNLFLKNSSTTQNSFAGVAFDVSSENDEDSTSASIAAIRVTSGTDTDHMAHLAFAVNGTAGSDATLQEAMRIMYNGNVGIGTNNPDHLLSIDTGDSDTQGGLCITAGELSYRFINIMVAENDNNTNSIFWDDGDALAFGVGTANTLYAPSTTYMTILPGGNVGIGTDSPDGLLELESANLGSNPMLQLKCTEADLDSNEIFMRIDADQDANIHGATVRLITFYDSGGEMGYITTASDGVVNAITASDVRLKKNIKDTTINGLSIINALKIRDYSWNEKAGKARDNLKVTAQYVADEVYEVYPLATTGKPGAMRTEITPAVKKVEAVEAKDAVLDGDGNVIEAAVVAVVAVEAVAEKTEEVIDAMGVSDARLISVLIKAVQELSAKVEALGWVADFEKYTSNQTVKDLLATLDN